MRRCAEVEIMNDTMQQNHIKETAHTPAKGPRNSSFPNSTRVSHWRFDNATVNCIDGENGCLLIHDVGVGAQVIVECESIEKDRDGNMFFVGKKTIPSGVLYSSPTPSSDVGIVLIRVPGSATVGSWPADRLIAKLLKVPHGHTGEEFAVFPIAHTYKYSSGVE
ncbi:hypothetical protein QAD02_013518 [Eretmocerus hayati]|uniref:Uncharacterized protein n=1 Tax=Eretmocerus hayati TaxID=131215 RepID=A0ACC2P3U1_9HYME|nr:hypothetical protein QAD02_013518 [Eretmocerus hayati]